MKKLNLSRALLLFGILLFSAVVVAQPTSQSYSKAGTYTYTVPAGYKVLVKVEAWGAGGGGGGGTFSGRGSGGGGGAYASKTLTLTEGNYTVVVGKGGNGCNAAAADPTPDAATNGGSSSFGGTMVIANGGAGGNGRLAGSGGNVQGGTGGAASTGDGYSSFAGGNGGMVRQIITNGSGGGGGAFPTKNGGDGVSPNELDGGKGGEGYGDGLMGDGGEGGYPGDKASNGYHPGGGGGGKYVGTRYGGNGADGWVIVTFLEEVLPVGFGPIDANVFGNKISLSFTTLQETNNDYFNVQLSENGKDFKTVSTIKSKHGGSSGTTEYKLTIDLAGKVSMGLSALSLLGLGIFGYNRKNRLLVFSVLAIGLSSVVFISCNKNADQIAPAQKSEKLYLRLQQVDINGNSQYSKVITIKYTL